MPTDRLTRTLATTMLVFCALLPAPPALAQRSAAATIGLDVDLTDAPRGIYHAKLSMPSSPGPLTLLYPKWLPGEHGPTGPIADLVSLTISANGQAIPWDRDPHDMFAFHLIVPAGAARIDVGLDYLSPNATGQFSTGPATTDALAVMSWNTVLLYPEGPAADELVYQASLTLPAGWELSSALTEAGRSRGQIRFEPVSLLELVDSPVAAGQYHRTIDLTGTAPVAHRLQLVADSEAALALTPRDEQAFRKLVAEAIALFGSYHYRKYDFLLTLSDHVASFGLEHHESSDDRVAERTLIEEPLFNLRAGLLPHEFVHSWNGKYRRPAGLTRNGFEQPFETDLLWVYEGLTSYLGEVLTARSGLWNQELGHDSLALMAAELANQAGRNWRPLADTTRAAQILYGVPSDWYSLRRGVDFYDEGVMLWLEVDTMIRAATDGGKSLEDFCRSFFGGPSGQPPTVRPYSYEELVGALERTAGADWNRFFADRVYAVRSDSPVAGIENAGWRLVYTDEPNLLQKIADEKRKRLDLSFSLGLSLDTEDGRIRDVLPGSPAALAGLAPSAKLVAVNGRRWSPARLREAITAAKSAKTPIRLLVEDAEFFSEVAIDYHEGNRYPHLERIDGRADVLGEIMQPLTQ
jgi:predicted metalloprotease with PDZ domain